MTDWPGAISAMTIFADDLAESRAFYVDVFGLPVYYEDADSVVINFGNTLINVLRATEAIELIAPAEVGGPDAAARVQFTIGVDDVDATAAFRDPAGHIWEIAH